MCLWVKPYDRSNLDPRIIEIKKEKNINLLKADLKYLD